MQVKSRLSSLIAAVSGKISHSSKPANMEESTTTTNNTKGRNSTNVDEHHPNTNQPHKSIRTSPQLEKWHSALKIGKPSHLQQQLDSCHTDQPLHHHHHHENLEEDDEEEEGEDDGRLLPGRLLLGTKLLVEREAGSSRLNPAVISGHDGPRVAVTFKDQQQQQQAATSYYEAVELMRCGVMDLPALSSDRLRSGSRVAVFPFSEAPHLLPGTVR